MNCKECENWLYSYIEGEISSDLKDSIDRHLDDCKHCKNELLAIQALVNSLQVIKLPEPPPNFIQRTVPKLIITYNIFQKPVASFRTFWLIAASILFGGVIVSLFYFMDFSRLQNPAFINNLVNMFSGDISSWWVYTEACIEILVKKPYYVMIAAILASGLSLLWIRKKLFAVL